MHGDLQMLRDVRWAIEAVNRTVGGRFTCLMLGMAGKAMLNRRGIANTLVLGAKLSRGE
ncbi:lasso peptide biosynthesis protein [Roseicyclus salinarum]|uniref:lasso peptide biosynthesis protein n=1 Tax=Roseicyclus salinarum TaxID=3036773 RepID=UPI003D339F44